MLSLDSGFKVNLRHQQHRNRTFSSGECSKSLTRYPEKNPLVSHTRKMPPGLVGSTTTPTNLQLCLAPLFIDSCSVSCGDPAVPLSSRIVPHSSAQPLI